MRKINLVLGANGHLGNNLVRILHNNREKVRAAVRNVDNQKAFNGLDCERVYADILDMDSLINAMEGVDTLYIAAAAYKSWAKDIQKDIIHVNIQGTRNIMEAAAARRVDKIVYTSSTFALDHDRPIIDETCWNRDYSDPYRMSKTEAEKLAWELAKKYDLWMVSVLPSGMVGPNCFGHLTPSMGFLSKVISNHMPIDPNFNFSIVDIREVAEAMIKVTHKGKGGERYILSQKNPINSREVFSIARSVSSSIIIPPRKPYVLMIVMAAIMEWISKLTKKKPLMLRSQIKGFRRANYLFNTTKAYKELGFKPKPQRDTLIEAFEYLKEHRQAA